MGGGLLGWGEGGFLRRRVRIQVRTCGNFSAYCLPLLASPRGGSGSLCPCLYYISEHPRPSFLSPPRPSTFYITHHPLLNQWKHAKTAEFATKYGWYQALQQREPPHKVLSKVSMLNFALFRDDHVYRLDPLVIITTCV